MILDCDVVVVVFVGVSNNCGCCSPCRFHPGKFRDPETSSMKSGALVGWSCCSIRFAFWLNGFAFVCLLHNSQKSERFKMPAMIAMAGFLPGVSELVSLDSATLRKDAPGCVQGWNNAWSICPSFLLFYKCISCSSSSSL
jgi:hypothetical protein